ncbi:MAG: hypothetical protein ACI4XW_03730 [Candidatus Spyradocola sp.]
MKTICFQGRTPDPRCITVGMQGDHNAECVRFEVPLIGDEICLLYLSAGSTGDVVKLENGIWTPERTYMRRPARYQCYLERHRGSEMVWHSEPFELHVDRLPAIGDQIARVNPTLLDQTVEQVQKALGAASAVERRAHEVEEFTAALGKVSVDVEMLPADETAHGKATMDRENGLYLSLAIPEGAVPVRGTDYWTETDIAEMKAYIDDAILGGEW